MPEPCPLVAVYDSAAEAMRRHVQREGCEDCRRALREMLGLAASELGAKGGSAGKGAAKSRPLSSERARELVRKRWARRKR